MAFALSGNVITQSGTDTSLAGLSAIVGVTTQVATGSIYTLTTYTLTNLKLTINGNLSMSRNEKIIFTGQGASADILNINGGIFTVNQVYTRNSYAYSLPQEAIVFALTSGGTWSTQVLRTQQAGRLICKNSLIRIPHSIWFEHNGSGQVLLENVVIDKTGSVGDIQTNHAGTVQNNTVFRNVTILADGQSGITFRNPVAPTIENVKIYQSRDAFNNESNQPKLIRGLEPNLGNLADVSHYGANKAVVVNAQKGTQFIWGGHLETAGSNTGEVAVFQEISAKITDATGVAIQGAVLYVTDNPVAADSTQTSVTNANLIGTLNPANRITYISSSNASGVVAQQSILIGTGKRTVGGLQIAGGNDNRIRPRGVNTTNLVDATDDLYNYSVLGYSYLQSNNPVVLKSGNGNSIILSPQLLPDTAVTLSETNAVAKLSSSFTVVGNVLTVTANSTLDNLYDAMKAYKTRPVQAQLEYPTIGSQPVTASGDQLATAMTVTVNAGVTLSGGVKFKSLASGGLTLIGSITGFEVAGNVTQITPSNLTNVTITGTLTYNTAAVSTITFTGVTVGSVVNSGAGFVTVKLTNSTATAGANVTTFRPTSLVFALNGGRIRILDHLGIEQFNQTSDGIFELPSVATGTWTYVIRKYGNQAIVGSVAIDGTIKTVAASFIPDIFVVDTLANVSAYTDLNSTQKIYDYLSFYGTDSVGITLGVVASKGFGTLTISAGLTTNPAAGAVIAISGGVVTSKTSALSEVVALISNGVISTGATILSDGVAIRANNLDSELSYTADALTFYPSANDRNNGTSPGASIVGGLYRFKFGATVSGVILSGLAFLRATVGGVTFFADINLATGRNVLDLGIQSQIAALTAKTLTLPQIEATKVLALKSDVWAAS